MVPFWTSFLIRTYALKIILDPNGYLARDLGINIMYTKYAVAVGLVYNYLPLFILPVFASLERMDWTLIEAATDLGARPFTAFRQITLRLTLPGVVTGALLVFIPMTGEYIIPNILSGGNYEFVGNVIGDQFNQAQNQPFGSALSIALMAALSVFVVVYILFATKRGAVRCLGTASAAKHGFTAWALVVYAFLYLPILVMVIFAFNKPSPAAARRLPRLQHLQHPARPGRQHHGLERVHRMLVQRRPARPDLHPGDHHQPPDRRGSGDHRHRPGPVRGPGPGPDEAAAPRAVRRPRRT